jgi:hypothetical protein
MGVVEQRKGIQSCISEKHQKGFPVYYNKERIAELKTLDS